MESRVEVIVFSIMIVVSIAVGALVSNISEVELVAQNKEYMYKEGTVLGKTEKQLLSIGDIEISQYQIQVQLDTLIYVNAVSQNIYDLIEDGSVVKYKVELKNGIVNSIVLEKKGILDKNKQASK